MKYLFQLKMTLGPPNLSEHFNSFEPNHVLPDNGNFNSKQGAKPNFKPCNTIVGCCVTVRNLSKETRVPRLAYLSKKIVRWLCIVCFNLVMVDFFSSKYMVSF